MLDSQKKPQTDKFPWAYFSLRLFPNPLFPCFFFGFLSWFGKGFALKKEIKQ
jgi:hypothetical protein